MVADAKIFYLQERIARFDDQAAYKELFINFYNPLLQFALSFVKSKQQAEEIVSDVFINIWEKRKRIETVNNLRVYLYVITKNISLNYIAKEKKLSTINIEEAAPDMGSIYFNPEQLMVTAEMVARIRSAIQKLPPKCRMIFKLVKEDELKYREVAEILQLSIKTIEAQMTIALKKIGEAIQFDIKKTISTTGRVS